MGKETIDRLIQDFTFHFTVGLENQSDILFTGQDPDLHLLIKEAG